MRDFRELILAHPGKRICVMGGADSLAADLGAVRADIYISVNGHGASLRRPDYLLAMDERNSRGNGPMGEHLRSVSDAPIISPHPYADYRLSAWPQSPRFVLSGLVAAWAAWLMGAEAALLAGMDAYGGAPGHLREAEKMARDLHGPVRVVGGGALTAVWPAYDDSEVFGTYAPSPAIDGWRGLNGRIRIRVLRATQIAGREVRPQEEIDVMRHEVKRLIRHHMVVEVEPLTPHGTEEIGSPGASRRRGRPPKVRQ